MGDGTLVRPWMFNRVFAYKVMDLPTAAPNINRPGLKVASETSVPIVDADVNRGDPDMRYYNVNLTPASRGSNTIPQSISFGYRAIGRTSALCHGDRPTTTTTATTRGSLAPSTRTGPA